MKNKSNKLSNQTNGFTLIELMIVIVIIGVIFGTVITVTNGLNRRGRDAKRQSDLHNIQSAIQTFYADNHYYPEAPLINPLLSGGGTFTNNGRTYMSTVPRDPGTTNYCYSSQIALSNSTGCSDTINSTQKCQYYQLCANLEDPISGSVACTCNGTPYNFSLHSP